MSKQKTKALDLDQLKKVIVLSVAVTFTSAIIASVAINALLVGSITKEVVVNVYLTTGTAGIISYILIHLTLGYLNRQWTKQS